MLRLSTRSLSAALRMICLRCEVVEVGVGWGHVDSCGRGLRPGVWMSLSKWGRFPSISMWRGPLGLGWTRGHRTPMPGAQWVAGMHHQGWAAWQQQSVSGGQRKVVGGLSLDVLVQVGVDRWPQLRQADAWASAEARFSHVVEGSGTFTAEVGWDRARGLSRSMDMVRLVAASQPSGFVGVSGVDVVSGRTMGRPVEPRSNLVG